MKLLILGGTIFLGRHLVDAAQARGHEVTLFNRGQHNTDLYPTLEKLRGDRDGNLGVLRGRQWDAVVDTCGYVPRLVRDSASLLANVVEHYTFISSISVYPDLQTHGLDENSPVGTLQDETVEEVNGETYGPLKALCEQAAEAAMPGRVLNVRAGLIVGPHDQSIALAIGHTELPRVVPFLHLEIQKPASSLLTVGTWQSGSSRRPKCALLEYIMSPDQSR